MNTSILCSRRCHLGRVLALAVSSGCASTAPSTSVDKEMTPMKPIYEIAVQQIHADAEDTYPAARRAFLEVLKEQPGNQEDWTFESFFTMPQPNEGTVLVGITRWASMESFANASEALMSTERAQAVFSKVDMKAFVQARPVDGVEFVLERYIDSGDQVLEVAIRKPKPGVSEADYQRARDAFFAQVGAQPGYLFDQELVDDAGHRIVLIGWSSAGAFEAALQILQTRPEMGAFFSMIDVQAYQAARLR